MAKRMGHGAEGFERGKFESSILNDEAEKPVVEEVEMGHFVLKGS